MGNLEPEVIAALVAFGLALFVVIYTAARRRTKTEQQPPAIEQRSELDQVQLPVDEPEAVPAETKPSTGLEC